MKAVCDSRSLSEKTPLGSTCRSLPQWPAPCPKMRIRPWRRVATAISSSRSVPRKSQRESTICHSVLARSHPDLGRNGGDFRVVSFVTPYAWRAKGFPLALPLDVRAYESFDRRLLLVSLVRTGFVSMGAPFPSRFREAQVLSARKRTRSRASRGACATS